MAPEDLVAHQSRNRCPRCGDGSTTDTLCDKCAPGIFDAGFMMTCDPAYHELADTRTRCRCGRLTFAYSVPPGKGVHKIAVESGETFLLKLHHDAEYPMVALDGGAFELMAWPFGKPR